MRVIFDALSFSAAVTTFFLFSFRTLIDNMRVLKKNNERIVTVSMFVIGLVPNSVDPSAKLVIFSLFCFFCSLFFQSHKLHIIHSFYDGFFCSMLASKRYLKLSTIKKEHITTIDFPSLTNKCAFVLAILKRNSRMHVGEINTVLLRQFQLLSLFLCPDKNGMFFFSFCCTMSSDKC